MLSWYVPAPHLLPVGLAAIRQAIQALRGGLALVAGQDLQSGCIQATALNGTSAKPLSAFPVCPARAACCVSRMHSEGQAYVIVPSSLSGRPATWPQLSPQVAAVLRPDNPAAPAHERSRGFPSSLPHSVSDLPRPQSGESLRMRLRHLPRAPCPAVSPYKATKLLSHTTTFHRIGAVNPSTLQFSFGAQSGVQLGAGEIRCPSSPTSQFLPFGATSCVAPRPLSPYPVLPHARTCRPVSTLIPG